MAVTLQATLLSAAAPRPVQLTLGGVPAGQRFEVVATTGDGVRRGVSGGVGVSTGVVVLLIDNRTPLNTPITYQALVGGVTYAAAPVTVDSAGVAVVQSLDGRDVVPVEIASLTEQRSAEPRSSTFEIAGRSDPAARLDVAGSFSYSWTFDTQGAATVALTEILRTGRPIVRRLNPGMRDLETVVIGLVRSWKDELITDGLDTWRRFSLTVREIADPQPSTALVVFVWDDFDAALSNRVWSSTDPAVRTFDEIFATWDEFDAANWAG
ncbi:hypothetical protein FHS07_001885 [Microbacterium proteolyticum]|uniref:Uncharacterized protein n=1 Tax=Microbacterium proteolyticum TaxID=1572644 RepID=A0A7W5CJ19_9MICO|nr:hypothetical protein [Microbacterium proteolyticum]MBB3158189.1 hypothetical protein [Microbacterium proteolyticum]